MLKKVTLAAVALVALLSLAAPPSHAGSRSSYMFVYAQVALTCYISYPYMSFGTYSGDWLTTTADITVQCNDAEVPYTVAAGDGYALDSGGYYRGMLDAYGSGGILKYGLETPDYNWFGNSGGYGDTNNGYVYSRTTAAGTDTQTITGWIYGGQLAPPSTYYYDEVILTVFF